MYLLHIWLTLTWDVFKLLKNRFWWYGSGWLTLTWDVFKYLTEWKQLNKSTGLTLTWDVFKSKEK